MVVRKLWRLLKKTSSSVRYYLWGLQSNCCWWSASAALSGKPLGNGTHCGELEAAERSAVNHQRVRYSELLKTTVRSQTHTHRTPKDDVIVHLFTQSTVMGTVQTPVVQLVTHHWFRNGFQEDQQSFGYGVVTASCEISQGRRNSAFQCFFFFMADILEKSYRTAN